MTAEGMNCLKRVKRRLNDAQISTYTSTVFQIQLNLFTTFTLMIFMDDLITKIGFLYLVC